MTKAKDHEAVRNIDVAPVGKHIVGTIGIFLKGVVDAVDLVLVGKGLLFFLKELQLVTKIPDGGWALRWCKDGSKVPSLLIIKKNHALHMILSKHIITIILFLSVRNQPGSSQSPPRSSATDFPCNRNNPYNDVAYIHSPY